MPMATTTKPLIKGAILAQGGVFSRSVIAKMRSSTTWSRNAPHSWIPAVVEPFPGSVEKTNCVLMLCAGSARANTTRAGQELVPPTQQSVFAEHVWDDVPRYTLREAWEKNLLLWAALISRTYIGRRPPHEECPFHKGLSLPGPSDTPQMSCGPGSRPGARKPGPPVPAAPTGPTRGAPGGPGHPAHARSPCYRGEQDVGALLAHRHRHVDLTRH